MNTPAHVVLNLLVLGRDRPAAAQTPIVAGALAPDVPMFLFYAWEKLGRGTPESVIWSETYFDPRWQDFFDVWNSLPLIAVVAAAGWLLSSRWAVLFASSMALHVALDLPLHHDDGHRHLFPFSDWRFVSPVSYWDPNHFGAVTAPLEGALVLGGCAVLWRRHPSRGARTAIGFVIALYLVYAALAVAFWLGAS